MLVLNNRIRKFLIENCGVKSDADDATFQKVGGEAIASGKGGFTFAKYQELSKEPDLSLIHISEPTRPY